MMSIQVCFLSEVAIERAAERLLRIFGREQKPIKSPPVPVEEILVLLGLSCDFDNLRKLFQLHDVLGALWVSTKEVFIDETLDPVTNPGMEGRYRFTLSHEIGHWHLHRRQVSAQSDSGFGRRQRLASVVCRTSDSSPIEVQANAYASCLLMPRDMILDWWKKGAGGRKSISVANLREYEHYILRQDRRIILTQKQRVDALFDWAGAPLADLFQVSRTAMRLRLQRLGLLRRPISENGEVLTRLVNAEMFR